MDTDAAGSRDVVADSSCIAFIFSIGGFALLDAWLLILHAGVQAHGIVLASGALVNAVTGLCVWRDRRHASIHGSIKFKQTGVFDIPQLARLVPPALAGISLGTLIVHAKIFPLALLAVGMVFTPWSRVFPFYRHIIATCLGFWTGAAVTLAIGFRTTDIMFLPIACWVFCTCACLALIRRAEYLWRSERHADSKATAA